MYHGSRLTFYGGARARPCRGRGRARVEDEDETDRGRQTRDRVRYNNSLLVRVVVARHAASRVRRRRGVGAAHEKLAQESKRVRRSRRVELHHPVVQRARDGGFEVRLGRVRGARVVVLGRSRLVVRGVCRRFKRRFERNASVNRSVVRSHRVASRRARARARASSSSAHRRSSSRPRRRWTSRVRRPSRSGAHPRCPRPHTRARAFP